MSENLPRIINVQQTIDLMGTREPDMRFQLYRRLKDSVGNFNNDNWWMYREATRFVRGEYRPILPFDQDWFGHVTMNRAFLQAFPHIADNPEHVSWVPDAHYGVQDKRVVGKPGRMLQTLFGFDEPAVARFVNKFNAEQRPLELKFTESYEELCTVYQSGPPSCMSKGFAMNANPLRVYNCPHIKVAYALDRGRIVARTVVRTDREPWQYTRIYGNEFALSNLFAKLKITRSHDGLEGIVLGEPIPAQPIGRMYIAYLDSPSQHVILDWQDHTLTVSSARPTKLSQHQLVANSAEGMVAVPGHIITAWQIGKMVDPITKKKATPFDRFWAGVDTDEDGNILCVECDEYYHPDENEVNWQGRAVCTSCIDSEYRWAVMDNQARRDWVHKEFDGLIYIECIGDYCCNVDPCAVFDVVEDIHGEYLSQEFAVFSTLQEGYIDSRFAREIWRAATEEDGDERGELIGKFYRDRVEERWLDRHSENIVILSDVRIRRVFNHRFYYIEERTAHDIEAIGTQMAETFGAARRSILAERPQEFAERLTALARSEESDRDRTNLLTDVPNFLAAIVRSRLSEDATAPRAAQSRSAAR